MVKKNFSKKKTLQKKYDKKNFTVPKNRFRQGRINWEEGGFTSPQYFRKHNEFDNFK